MFSLKLYINFFIRKIYITFVLSMKTLVLISFYLLSISCFCQTKIDSILFDKINKYRISKNLNELKWDTISYKSSNLHTLYLQNKNISSHYEDSQQLKTPSDRFKYFGGKNNVNEIITGVYKNYIDNELLIYDKLMNITLDNWIKSKPHNDILTNPSLKYGGCSTTVLISEQGIKNCKNYSTISVFILY